MDDHVLDREDAVDGAGQGDPLVLGLGEENVEDDRTAAGTQRVVDTAVGDDPDVAAELPEHVGRPVERRCQESDVDGETGLEPVPVGGVGAEQHRDDAPVVVTRGGVGRAGPGRRGGPGPGLQDLPAGGRG